MRSTLLLLCTISFAPIAATAHERKCDEFPTYADALRHCKESTHHSWPTKCGNHDRDKDGRPCECRPGGPETDTQACKSKRKK